MEEISQDLDWYHNQYQTSHHKARVHLILRKTLITVQHQMYALSLSLSITPHLSHEYCFYLTTILSTMSKLETHAYSYFPFVDNIVAHWIEFDVHVSRNSPYIYISYADRYSFITLPWYHYLVILLSHMVFRLSLSEWHPGGGYLWPRYDYNINYIKIKLQIPWLSFYL